MPREQLVAASSVNQSTLQLTSIVAPAPAGIIIKALGLAWAFFLDAISFLFIIGALWKLPNPPRPQSAAKKSVLASIAEGIAYVGKDVPLRSLMLTAAMMNFCLAGPLAVGLPYLAKTQFGSPTAYGMIVAAAAAGGLSGSLLAGVWRVHRRGILNLAACALLGICLGTIGLLPRLWMIAAVLLLMGASAGLANVHIVAWIQQRIDPSVRGRVMSVLALAAVGLAPISLAAAGFLVAWNLKLMFLLAGAAMLAVIAISAFQREVRDIQ